MPISRETTQFEIVVKGRRAVLRHEALLKDLAERSAQPGSMHWLGYFLSGRGTAWKRPCLVLVLNKRTSVRDLSLNDVVGAVLLFEVIFLGFGVRTFATDDWEATRTVIASPEARPTVVAHAINALLARGAQIILISYDGPSMPRDRTTQILTRKGVLWAEHTRELRKTLALSPSLELTLARFGKQTRFNLGYYRRRLNLQAELEFVPDAKTVVTRDDMLALNRLSSNPVTTSEIDRRLRVLREQDSFLVGLREKNDGWLSILDGWRQADTTVMHFQLNTTARPKDSIGTVMRCYLLESEIARNTKKLSIYHGTNHPMVSAFEVASVRDVIVRRQTVRYSLLLKLAERIRGHSYNADPEDYRGSVTFLASVLTTAASEWHTTMV